MQPDPMSPPPPDTNPAGYGYAGISPNDFPHAGEEQRASIDATGQAVDRVLANRIEKDPEYEQKFIDQFWPRKWMGLGGPNKEKTPKMAPRDQAVTMVHMLATNPGKAGKVAPKVGADPDTPFEQWEPKQQDKAVELLFKELLDF